jgi:hypothetical protein
VCSKLVKASATSSHSENFFTRSFRVAQIHFDLVSDSYAHGNAF